MYPSPAIAPDASMHRLTCQALESVNEVVAHDHFVVGEKSVNGLAPDTTYTIRIYSDVGTGSGCTLTGQVDVTTDSNLSSNYEVCHRRWHLRHF